jgi:hypothetical protein
MKCLFPECYARASSHETSLRRSAEVSRFLRLRVKAIQNCPSQLSRRPVVSERPQQHSASAARSRLPRLLLAAHNAEASSKRSQTEGWSSWLGEGLTTHGRGPPSQIHLQGWSRCCLTTRVRAAAESVSPAQSSFHHRCMISKPLVLHD